MPGPVTWDDYRKMKRALYLARRKGPQFINDDFAFFIDAISWDDEQYGDIFGPDKVNHAHHNLMRARCFLRASEREFIGAGCAGSRITYLAISDNIVLGRKR